MTETKGDSSKVGDNVPQDVGTGGSIGTGLFVNIGNGLNAGRPASLLLAYMFYFVMVVLVNNCMAEMVTLFPVSGGFVRLAGAFVDESFGFMAGWNFFLYQALLIPFEISALNLVITFWSDDVPIWAVCLAVVILYGYYQWLTSVLKRSLTLNYKIFNALVVSAYGEIEFWLSMGKVLLIFILFSFTFVTMVGGNPRRDAYGFRYWKTPGAFAEHISVGALGRFEGFLAALFNASFAIVGPEFLSMVAAEAIRPRVYMKAAYKSIYYRFLVFFIGSSIACGVVIPYNDLTLVKVMRGSSSGSGTAQASPYVIAMQNLMVDGLPHVINILLVNTIFSAGNAYVFCTTRCLYSLSIEGRAPKFLRHCTKRGVPIYCLGASMAFSLLSFLQVNSKTSEALSIIISLVTAAAFINYVVMSITYVFYYRAVTAQKIDRKTLPYYGCGQPYCGWISVFFFTCITGAYGYTSLKPWNTLEFLSSYTMPLLAPVFYGFWKTTKKTTLLRPQDVDLLWERPFIDAYEDSIIIEPVSFWTELVQLVGFRRREGGNDRIRQAASD